MAIGISSSFNEPEWEIGSQARTIRKLKDALNELIVMIVDYDLIETLDPEDADRLGEIWSMVNV